MILPVTVHASLPPYHLIHAHGSLSCTDFFTSVNTLRVLPSRTARETSGRAIIPEHEETLMSAYPTKFAVVTHSVRNQGLLSFLHYFFLFEIVFVMMHYSDDGRDVDAIQRVLD